MNAIKYSVAAILIFALGFGLGLIVSGRNAAHDDYRGSMLYSQAKELLDPSKDFDLDAWQHLMQEDSLLNDEQKRELDSLLYQRIKLLSSKKDSVQPAIDTSSAHSAAPIEENKGNQQKQQEEQRLYNKALTGSIDDCHTYVWKYRPGGGLNEYTTQARMNTISARKAELAKQLAYKARDTRLGKQERINAAKKYLQYYPNGNAAGEMRDTIKALSNASNGSTGNSQQNQPAANARSTTTKQSSEINKLTTPYAIFNNLTWDNVKDNGKKFKDQFKCEKRMQERVDKIISKANSVGKKGYEEARKKANVNLPNGVNKLTALEHYIGLHGMGCKPLH